YLAKASDLVAHAARFSTPSAMVDELGRSVEHFGRQPSGARKKAWMYLRWMVRPAPDLRLFTTFQPHDLQIPLDVNTCRALGVIRVLLPSDEYLSALELQSGRPIANAANRELATRFAGPLRADDRAGLDYPLFLLGREKDITQALGSV